MPSIYALKPAFQSLLRPGVAFLAKIGVTANTVTVFACVASVALGAVLYLAASPALFLLLPAWMFLRMALNAVDGMLAREFGQQSRLGGYLNELTDVIADAALYLPFALVAPFHPAWVVAVVLLAMLSEFAGALGPMMGSTRRYEGPMGKSDRAFVLGALGLWHGLTGALPAFVAWTMPLLCALLLLTCFNRVRAGLASASDSPPQ
ncbi:CDP-alcohol phosphatidyltransferase family protein [Arenimonas sp.]|uniref:CDP-alcohol phosphatidyltransferase family protein n=1 Tax=Arenimonas sp. TaxID=1872635 RepID=UPI0039E729B3